MRTCLCTTLLHDVSGYAVEIVHEFTCVHTYVCMCFCLDSITCTCKCTLYVDIRNYLFVYSDKPAIPLSSNEVKALKVYVSYVHVYVFMSMKYHIVCKADIRKV